MTPDIAAIELEEALTVSRNLAEGDYNGPTIPLHESDCLHRVLGEVEELQRKLIYYKKALEEIKGMDYRGNRSSESIMAFNALNNGP